MDKRKIDDVIGTGPLGPVTKRSIRIEARLQLQGAIFKPDLSDLNSDDDKIVDKRRKKSH